MTEKIPTTLRSFLGNFKTNEIKKKKFQSQKGKGEHGQVAIETENFSRRKMSII